MLRENMQACHASIHPFHHAEPRPQPKTFRHSIDICLKDSNVSGNTYFSRYFEWQGVCREQWFHQCICDNMLQSKEVFVTKCAHQDYAQETFPFQKLECRLNAYNIKQCSFNLLFRFYVGDKLVSRGYQQVVYASRDKKILRLPKEMRDKIREYEEIEF